MFILCETMLFVLQNTPLPWRGQRGRWGGYTPRRRRRCGWSSDGAPVDFYLFMYFYFFLFLLKDQFCLVFCTYLYPSFLELFR